MSETHNNQTQESKSFAAKAWIAGGILALIAVVLLLFKVLFSIILLTFAAAMIAIYFLGFADLIERNLHLSRGWSMAISVVFNLALIVAFFWFVGDRLGQQVSQLSDTLPATIEHARSKVSETALGRKVLDQVNNATSAEKVKAAARQLFSSAYGTVSDLYIVLLIAVFFISSPTLYKRGLVHLMPVSAKDKGDAVLDKLYEMLKSWLKGQIIGVFFIGILTAAGLLVLGMPLVLTLALIAGILNLIPNFGPLIALIPAVLLGLLQGTSTALLVIAVYQGIQIIQSAVMQPIVQKKMVSMPPALIIISQIAMGTLGGFWGLLLATPTVVIIMTLVNELYVKRQPHHKYKVQ